MEKGLFTASTFTSGRILPIEGVNVYISRENEGGEELLFALKTDENGNTQVVELDAPDMELSENPGNYRPFSVYNVRAVKDGFFRTGDLAKREMGSVDFFTFKDFYYPNVFVFF